MRHYVAKLRKKGYLEIEIFDFFEVMALKVPINVAFLTKNAGDQA